MGKRIESDLRELERGVTLAGGTSFVVSYEPLGHLSFRLLDAAGQTPLVRYRIAVDVPGEGRVTGMTDAQGRFFHANVPFQDYAVEIEGSDGTFVLPVPAVALRTEVYDRHAPAELWRYVALDLRGGDPRSPLALEGNGRRVVLESRGDGVVTAAAQPPGRYRVHDGDEPLEVELPALPVPTVLDRDASR
jgi:hypothetical protein